MKFRKYSIKKKAPKKKSNTKIILNTTYEFINSIIELLSNMNLIKGTAILCLGLGSVAFYGLRELENKDIDIRLEIIEAKYQLNSTSKEIKNIIKEEDCINKENKEIIENALCHKIVHLTSLRKDKYKAIDALIRAIIELTKVLGSLMLIGLAINIASKQKSIIH